MSHDRTLELELKKSELSRARQRGSSVLTSRDVHESLDVRSYTLKSERKTDLTRDPTPVTEGFITRFGDR